MIDLFYRRPTRVSSADVELWPTTIDADEMRNRENQDGIPPGLSFDRIVDGRTCYPCRLKDFMFYLRFVEFSAENLRFYLWYRSYCERFEKLSPGEKAMSPPFVPDSGSRRRGDWILEADDKNPPIASSSADGAFLKRSSSTASDDDVDDATLYPSKVLSVSSASTLKDAGDFGSLNVGDQPFRSELSRVASLFLYPSSPLELNLSSRDRHLTLRAIHATTHPSALIPALLTAERFLRWQSHPNFIRRQISNANNDRTTLMVVLGVFSTVAMISTAIPLVLSSKGRGWRVFPAAFGALAVVSVFCRKRNFCWAYYSRGGRRSTEPWDAVGGWEVTKDIPLQTSQQVTPRRNSEDIEATAADDKQVESSADLRQVHDFEFPGERLAAENVRMFEGRGLAGRGLEIGVRVKDRTVQKIQFGIYLQMWLIYLVALGIICAVLMPLPKVGLIK